MKKKVNIKNLLKVVITAVFLWWVVFKVDWPQVWENLQKVELVEILVYVFLYFLGMLASSYKWQALCKAKEIDLPLKKYFQYYFSATFVNNFMPSFIGGDAFKAYQVGEKGGKYKQAISSVVVDRITGLWGAMTLALFFAFFNRSVILENQVLLFINLGVFAALIGSFLFLRYPGMFAILPGKIGKFLQKAMGEVLSYNNGSNVIVRSVLLSFLFNFIGLAGANYVLFYALDIKIAFLDYLSVIFLISIVSSVPVTINNIGIKEWAYITFFGIFGAASSAVVTVAILSRMLQMLLSFLAWPIYLRNEKSDFSKISLSKVFAKKPN